MGTYKQNLVVVEADQNRRPEADTIDCRCLLVILLRRMRPLLHSSINKYERIDKCYREEEAVELVLFLLSWVFNRTEIT